MQKPEKLNLDQKENFSQRSLVSPWGSRGRPALRPAYSLLIQPLPWDEKITNSSLARGIKLGTIQYFTIQYKLHLSRAFHACHLKALYDPFFKKGRENKENLKEKTF